MYNFLRTTPVVFSYGSVKRYLLSMGNLQNPGLCKNLTQSVKEGFSSGDCLSMGYCSFENFFYYKEPNPPPRDGLGEAVNLQKTGFIKYLPGQAFSESF